MEDKTSNKAIGKRIKQLREKNKEKQKDLATLLDTTQNSISKVENGTSGLKISNLITIAEHYRVSLDYLCRGIGGADLLDTLTNYVGFGYRPVSGIADDNNTHRIPSFSINGNFFKYLYQIAEAYNNSAVPESLKDIWVIQAEKEFNDKITDDNSISFSFIPLEDTVLQEQRSIINAIEKHISISTPK